MKVGGRDVTEPCETSGVPAVRALGTFQILGAQQPDGSFKRGRPNWPAGDAADPIYRQCLCTLQLEVYYRYLKVADRVEQSIFER